MSLVDSAFNGDDTWWQRALASSAHLLRYAIVVQIALCLPYYFGVDGWAIKAGHLLALVLIFLGFVHNNLTRLCLRCMEEVPADAGVQADQQQWLLKAAHALDRRRNRFAGLAVAVAVAVAVQHGFPRIVQLPVDVGFALYLYSLWLHHKLRPWCPYCKPWDGGDGIREPSPDPVDKAVR